MRVHQLSPLVIAVAAGLFAAPTLANTDFEFNGYMRAGIGANADGGAAAAYGNGGSGHAVGRLG
ncbi:MAG: maltoporin, partial [Vibrio sp.]